MAALLERLGGYTDQLQDYMAKQAEAMIADAMPPGLRTAKCRLVEHVCASKSRCGRRLSPEQLSVAVEETGADGVASVRISGRWDGPAGVTRATGWVNYRLRLMRGAPYLFIQAKVRYFVLATFIW